MLNGGVDINVIRAWLDHVDLVTTNIYAESITAAKRKASRPASLALGGAGPSQWERDPDLN
jgi:hypothetical protein